MAEDKQIRMPKLVDIRYKQWLTLFSELDIDTESDFDPDNDSEFIPKQEIAIMKVKNCAYCYVDLSKYVIDLSKYDMTMLLDLSHFLGSVEFFALTFQC